MRFTSAQFLESACRWAYDQHTLAVDDDQFLPEIKRQGLSDGDIQRLKQDLERNGLIKNHRVVTGMCDFELRRSVFRRYLQRVLPAVTLTRARTLYESWTRSPQQPFGAAALVEHLGLSEREASYYLEALQE